MVAVVNPFIYAVKQPAQAFADLALIALFVAVAIGFVWALTSNAVWLYENNRKGGWDVLPPAEFAARLAIMPGLLAVLSWLVSAMFAMLG